MELRCSRLLTGQLTKWILRSYFRSFSASDKVQSQDPYKCLGVAPSASAKEIKAAFYKKSKELHPDWNSSPTANQDFGKVAEAYALLSDGEKRKDFNKKREAPGNSEFDVESWIKQSKASQTAKERQSASTYGTYSDRFTQYGHYRRRPEDFEFWAAYTARKTNSQTESSFEADPFTQYGHIKRRSEDFEPWTAFKKTHGQTEPSFKPDWGEFLKIIILFFSLMSCILVESGWWNEAEKRPNKRLSTSAPENQMDNRNLAVKQSGRTSGEDT